MALLGCGGAAPVAYRPGRSARASAEPSPERAAATLAGPPRTPLVIATAPVEPPSGPVAAAPIVSRCAGAVPSRLSPRCRALAPVRVWASAGGETAARAFDGDTCTFWSAGGFSPQFVVADLGAVRDVHVIVLVPETTPSGGAVVRVEVSDDGARFSPAHRIQAPLASGVPIELDLPRPERARFLRFAVDSSPSWVAFREIALIACAHARE
jgi:hypothetical protein